VSSSPRGTIHGVINMHMQYIAAELRPLQADRACPARREELCSHLINMHEIYTISTSPLSPAHCRADRACPSRRKERYNHVIDMHEVTNIHWVIRHTLVLTTSKFPSLGMPYRITQCYLPPGRGDNPAFTTAEAGTRLSDPGGMQG